MGKKSRLKKLNRIHPDQNRTSQISSGVGREKFHNLLFALLFVLIFIVGVALRIYNLNNVSGRSPDEQIYTQQAKTIADLGKDGIKLLMQAHNSQKELWIYPPPTRIGYLGLLAQVMNTAKRTDANLGAYISFVFSIISLALLILLGLRFFNPWVSLYALTFMSVSGMDLAIARRTWLDAMLGCMGLALIYFCCEITRDSKRIFWYILFILIGSYSLLVKETAPAIYGLCIIWILWILFINEKAFIKGALFIIASGVGAAISALILIQAAGGIKPIYQVMQHVKLGLPTNTYAIEYQSGPWYNFLQGFWIISPLSAFLFILGVAGVVLHKGKLQKYLTLTNTKAVYGIIFFTIAFMVFSIALPACQNLRYVSVLFAPFYLMAGLGLWYLISLIRVRLSNFSLVLVSALCLSGIIIAAINDYKSFQKIFVKTGILDVSIRMVREFSR
jgi:hypothetical protein